MCFSVKPLEKIQLETFSKKIKLKPYMELIGTIIVKEHIFILLNSSLTRCKSK